jgi:hypothetical protein
MNMDCRNALAARHRHYPQLQLEHRASLRHKQLARMIMNRSGCPSHAGAQADSHPGAGILGKAGLAADAKVGAQSDFLGAGIELQKKYKALK